MDANSLNRPAVMVNDIIICTLDGFKTLTITDKASCGLFQTQHEAELHDIPADAH
jgi:hypothetical protein